MKNSYLINFSLFCQRKKFNLTEFIKANQDMTYENLSNYILKKNVCPPDRDLFDRCKKKAIIDTVNDEKSTAEFIKVKQEEKSSTKKKRNYRKNKKIEDKK